jgi:hypothetical protein
MAELADQESALLRRVPAVRRYDPETGLIVPLEAEGAWFCTFECLEKGSDDPFWPDAGDLDSPLLEERHHQLWNLAC